MEQKPEAHEDAILQIIDNVDNNFEKRLRKIYLSRKIDSGYYIRFAAVVYYIILFVVIAYSLSLITKALPTVGVESPSIQVAISISLTAAFIALASFGVNIQNLTKPVNLSDILFEYNYNVFKEKVAEENTALLKGLVMLKSKHPDLSLKDVLELPITKDKLFDILYK